MVNNKNVNVVLLARPEADWEDRFVFSKYGESLHDIKLEIIDQDFALTTDQDSHHNG